MGKLDRLIELLIIQTEAQLEINKLNAEKIAQLEARIGEFNTNSVSQNGFDATRFIIPPEKMGYF